METKYIRAHIIVEGNVQKVFYRLKTRDEAIELGLTGWIKNQKDGTVEAVFEGPENLVKEIILWCKSGPKLAQVKNLKVTYEKATNDFKDFTILSE